MDRKLPPDIAGELSALALLPDDQIDTSDAAEQTDWSSAVRGRFALAPVKQKGYDIRAIANWILDYASETGRAVSNLALNKLTYFVIERGVIERNVLFSDARVEAWNHGPVFREIYHLAKGNKSEPISVRFSKYSPIDRSLIEAREQFEMDDVEFFKSVLQYYQEFSDSELRRISHRQGGPWDKVWSSATKINPGMVISTYLIHTYAPKRRELND